MRDNILNKKAKYVYWDVCTWIAAICTGVYVLTFLINIRIKGIPLVYWLSIVPSFVKNGCIWQFVTSIFVHSSPAHLLLNMYALFIFGKKYEREFGSIEFLIFFFVCGIFGGIISYFIYILTGVYNVAIMGASGAIYGLLFMESVMYPRSRILLFLIIPMKLPVAMMVFIAVETIEQLVGSGADIAHLVHLSSIAVAWSYSILRFRISPWKVWKDCL